jgi:O-glycosyl hydrolase
MHDIVVQLGRRLDAEGFRTKLVIPDDENPVAAYRRAEAVLRDPEARTYVAAIAFHIYRGNEDDWAKLAELAGRYRVALWMTEYIDTEGHATWPAALRWATTMSNLITVGRVGAIDYLWGFFGDWNGPSGSLINIEFDHGVYRSFSYTPVYWLTGQYSRFVRPGYRHVTTTSSGSAPVSAFTSDGRVVVAINTNDQAQTVRVSVAGGRVRGPTSAVRTSAGENWKSLPPVPVRGSAFTAVLAPQSVTTYVLRRAK